jgi:ABC-2 type transport system ATP-binding protein
MDLALETRGLRRTFGDLVAVAGIDLAVPRGSLYGFLGPNGAGKSTTLNCLTGLLAPTAGAIRILGIDPAVDPVAIKKRIGVVPERLALFDRLTGRETLRFIGRVHGLDHATLEKRSGDLLKFMALEESANELVADYSHGMRKKIALASALLPAPALLFLDEPFEGIDAIASRQIKDLLVRFAKGGGTIFLTSHILEIVDKLATHVGVIRSGELIAQGPLDELRQGAARGRTLEEIFLGLVGASPGEGGALEWLAT